MVPYQKEKYSLMYYSQKISKSAFFINFFIEKFVKWHYLPFMQYEIYEIFW